MIQRVVLPAVRWWIGMLRSEETQVSPIGKLCRAVLLVPPFGFLLLLLRVRLMTLGPLRVETQLDDGTRFNCELPDLVQMYMFLFGVWEPDLTSYLHARLTTGDTLIDVGANVGYNSIKASKRVGNEGRVVAIEASSEIVNRLNEHIALNNARNVRVIHAAASDHEHELMIYKGPKHNTGLTATTQHRGMKPSCTVRASPIDTLVHDEELAHVRVIKIDVEGGEPAVIRSVLEVIDRLPRDLEIAAELSPGWWAERNLKPEDLLAPFRRRGFHVYVLENDYWPWRYLWPNEVKPPRRLRGSLSDSLKRIDVVLSRQDEDELLAGESILP